MDRFTKILCGLGFSLVFLELLWVASFLLHLR